jgi:hypothetical protein
VYVLSQGRALKDIESRTLQIEWSLLFSRISCTEYLTGKLQCLCRPISYEMRDDGILRLYIYIIKVALIRKDHDRTRKHSLSMHPHSSMTKATSAGYCRCSWDMFESNWNTGRRHCVIPSILNALLPRLALESHPKMKPGHLTVIPRKILSNIFFDLDRNEIICIFLISAQCSESTTRMCSSHLDPALVPTTILKLETNMSIPRTVMQFPLEKAIRRVQTLC